MQYIYRYAKWIFFSIPVLSLLLHFHVFSLDLLGYHVWRQSQTQTVINNFYSGDFNILNPQANNLGFGDQGILRMEFPLMQWLYALCFRVFGQSVALSRILTFLLGLCSVWGMYSLAKAVFKDSGIATVAAWCFNWSPVFYYYTVNPLPDNAALCCGIWCAAFFFRYVQGQRLVHLLLSAFLLLLATLTKLPFIITGGIVAGYGLVLLRNRRLAELGKIMVVYILALLPAVVWYVSVIPTWKGNGVATGIFGEKPDWAKLVHFAFGVSTAILPELLINYGSVLFFICGVWLLFKNKVSRQRLFPVFIAWAVAVLCYYIYEMNLIELVHDYYLFPFLPIIFLVVPYGARYLLGSGVKAWRILAMVAFCILPVTAFLRADTRWDEQLPGVNQSLYDHKEQLRALLPGDALVIAGNDDSKQIMLYYIDRKGWTFAHDDIDAAKLEQLIQQGATHLFSDSWKTDDPQIQRFVRKKLYEDAQLKVYELKAAGEANKQ